MGCHAAKRRARFEASASSAIRWRLRVQAMLLKFVSVALIPVDSRDHDSVAVQARGEAITYKVDAVSDDSENLGGWGFAQWPSRRGADQPMLWGWPFWSGWIVIGSAEDAWDDPSKVPYSGGGRLELRSFRPSVAPRSLGKRRRSAGGQIAGSDFLR